MSLWSVLLRLSVRRLLGDLSTVGVVTPSSFLGKKTKSAWLNAVGYGQRNGRSEKLAGEPSQLNVMRVRCCRSHAQPQH